MLPKLHVEGSYPFTRFDLRHFTIVFSGLLAENTRLGGSRGVAKRILVRGAVQVKLKRLDDRAVHLR